MFRFCLFAAKPFLALAAKKTIVNYRLLLPGRGSHAVTPCYTRRMRGFPFLSPPLHSSHLEGNLFVTQKVNPHCPASEIGEADTAFPESLFSQKLKNRFFFLI